ncbi:MAG: SOS response-associated peptidase [Polyangiaceae bacterium]|nr:SOS response-associated peptidase [Polyangiaceae bacterium]
MCGRYTLTNVAPNLLASMFGIPELEIPELSARFNIAPTQNVPIVRVLAKAAPPKMDVVRWGLVPSWADDVSIGNRMINARSETVAEKPAFRSSFKSKRCIVPADGFFEWKKTGGKKQPYWIHRRDNAPMGFAGLWARWKGVASDGQPVELDTFTILTTDPHPIVAPIHDRMPAILSRDSYATWLDPEEHRPDVLLPLIHHRNGEDLVTTPVAPRVNNPYNEGPANVQPVSAL